MPTWKEKIKKGHYFKKKNTKEPLFSQSKIMEIPMPQDLMEHLFDSSQQLGYESSEEKEYREEKDKYNRALLRKIKTKIKYTDRQREIMKLMFEDGLTLTQTAKRLNVSIGTVQEIRDAIVKKIRKTFVYKFAKKE